MTEPVNALIALARGDYCGKCTQYPCDKSEKMYDAPCENYERKKNDDEVSE